MITAASNSRIKRLVQLNQKSKLRRTEDVFLAEGVKMFLEAPERAAAGGLCFGILSGKVQLPGASGRGWIRSRFRQRFF